MTRCVVTGEDKLGSARVMSDGETGLSPLGGGFGFAHLWGSDQVPSFPQDGSMPRYKSLMPEAGGYRFAVMRILPERDLSSTERSAPVQLDPAVRELYAEAGIDDVANGEPPGMHRTDSIDLGVVVSGTVSMELDDGDLVELKAGDTFIQNGTNHKWSNRGDVPALVVVAIIGGHPRK
jgi:mannose-6-phosphate isomerase-like protein (cupin superfamily)